MESRQQTFRRTRSLDLTDSLDRIERRRKRREQFLENRAKFDVTLPPVSKYSNTSPYVKPLKPSNDNETSSVNFISELIQRLTIDPETQPYKSPAVNASSLLSETTSFDAPLVAEYIRTNMLEREGTQSLTGKMTPESKVQQTKNSAVYAVPLYLPEYFLSQPPKPSTEYVMDNKQSYSGESDSKISVPFSQADNNTFETVTLRRPSAFLKTGQKSNSSFALLRPSSFDALPVTESVKTTPTMPFAHSPTLPRWIDIAQTSPLLQTENASKPNGTSSECQSRIPLSTDSNLIQKKQLSLHKASVLRRSSSLQQVPAVESNKKCISTSSDISHSRQQNWRNQVVRASQEIGSKDHISNKFGNRYFDVVQSPKLDRRYSSNSLTFPRRSLTPTIPVKSLVQKFSFGK